MAIRRIKLSNFKSFQEAELELGNFSVLIGANASGKSNFVQIFKFLRDTMDFGLDSAISMQGGVEYLRNINIGSSRSFSIEVNCDEREPYVTAKGKPELEAYETLYSFTLDFTGFRMYEVAHEQLLQKCNFYKAAKREGGRRKRAGRGEIVVSRSKNEASLNFNPPKELEIDTDAVFQVYVTRGVISSGRKIRPRNLLTEDSLFLVGSGLKGNLSGVSLYDLNPKMPKRGQAITGSAELEEDGSNLAIALRNIMKSGNDRRRLFNLVRDILPFVDGLSVETFADKSMMLKMRESYAPRRPLPASLLSDGTINITALIVALYFGEKALKIIEEPGRNMHPYLASRVVSMMKEASKRSQVIVTTHNPEIVKHVDLEDILLISRDKNGYSFISRPSEKKEIQVFLENEMGIDELYVRNLLEM